MSRTPGKTPVLNLPWHVYLLLAEAIFMIFKWVLPSLCTAELCVRPHALDWSAMAWVFSGIFLLFAAAHLATRKRDAGNAAAGRPRLRGLFRIAGH